MKWKYRSIKLAFKRCIEFKNRSQFMEPSSCKIFDEDFSGLTGSGFFKGKRFLLLTHELSYTGAPLLLMETAQMLIDAGAIVKLVSPYRGHKKWSLFRKRLKLAHEHNIPVVPFSSISKHLLTSDFVIANTVTEKVMGAVDEIIKQTPDVIKKLIIWVHEIDVERYLPFSANINACSLRIFDSQACKDAWEEHIGVVQNSVVIHPSISPQMFEKLSDNRPKFSHLPTSCRPKNTHRSTRKEIRSMLGVGDNDFLVLCLGTISDRKGQAILLDTLSKISGDFGGRIKLCLVGFKNARRIKKFFFNMTEGERTVLAPERAYVSQTEIAAFYIAADVFVMNSQGENKGRGECFGRVTVEAMAAGLAVLGTSAGGTSEIIINEKSGYLFPPGTEGQAVLTHQIKSLINNPEKAVSLGLAARKYALENFNHLKFLRELEAVIATISQN